MAQGQRRSGAWARRRQRPCSRVHRRDRPARRERDQQLGGRSWHKAGNKVARGGHGCAAVLSSDAIGPRVGRGTGRLRGRSWRKVGDEVALGRVADPRRCARAMCRPDGSEADHGTGPAMFFWRVAAMGAGRKALKLMVACTYAPTTAAPAAGKDEFLEQPRACVASRRSHAVLMIVGGNINAVLAWANAELVRRSSGCGAACYRAVGRLAVEPRGGRAARADR
jgi:hypothetical protein